MKHLVKILAKYSGLWWFLLSMLVSIGLIGAFIWVNDSYLHIPIDGESECSGRFEHNCGNPDNIRTYEPTDRYD